MDNLKIVGAPLPDMPWEDRPEGSKEVLCSVATIRIAGRVCT